MRRALVAAVAMIGLVIVTGLPPYAVAAPKGPAKRAFTATVVGALISSKGTSFEDVYKITSSLDGIGAGILDGSTTGTSFPESGKATGTNYFADGVMKVKETFKTGAPNASGIAAITGSGKCVGGTGVHKKEKCTCTFTGTDNLNTFIFNFTATGTDTR